MDILDFPLKTLHDTQFYQYYCHILYCLLSPCLYGKLILSSPLPQKRIKNPSVCVSMTHWPIYKCRNAREVLWILTIFCKCWVPAWPGIQHDGVDPVLETKLKWFSSNPYKLQPSVCLAEETSWHCILHPAVPRGGLWLAAQYWTIPADLLV